MQDRYAARAATQAELDAERRSGLWHLDDGEDDPDAAGGAKAGDEDTPDDSEHGPRR